MGYQTCVKEETIKAGGVIFQTIPWVELPLVPFSHGYAVHNWLAYLIRRHFLKICFLDAHCELV